jgi:anti-sigma factor RsiW
MALFGRTVIVCRKAVDLLTDYLEDALPARDRARLEAHLAGCPHCAEQLRQMRTTIDALGRAVPDTLSPETFGELIALYQRWVAHPTF